jgi:hypothetical protein
MLRGRLVTDRSVELVGELPSSASLLATGQGKRSEGSAFAGGLIPYSICSHHYSSGAAWGGRAIVGYISISDLPRRNLGRTQSPLIWIKASWPAWIILRSSLD